MADALGYREEASELAGARPRRLRWRDWSSEVLRGAFLVPLVGLHAIAVIAFSLSFTLHVVELLYADTREAEVVDTAIHRGAKGSSFLSVTYRHEIDGRSVMAVRDVSLGHSAEVPPESVVAVGDRTTVACFTLGSYHHDDLAMPHESAFHRRATALVAHLFGVALCAAYVAGFWTVGIRPWLRHRALFRDGVLARGRLTGLRRVKGRKNRTKLMLRYEFEGPDGLPRKGSCEAVDRGGGLPALADGDAVNVLYDSGDWRHNHVYEVGRYVFRGEARALSSVRTP